MFMLGILGQRHFLWVLAFMAGFVDTATFTGAHGIFSAHVTGNFVVYTASLVNGSESLVKLLTFPFFVIGVCFISLSAKKIKQSKIFFVLIGSLIATSGILFTFCHEGLSFHTAVMVTVIAMGMQNAAHKLFLKGTPTSTVMTGNVTQLFMDLTSATKPVGYLSSLEMALSFFLGCILAALMTSYFGLISLIIPGLILTFSSLNLRDQYL